MRYIARSGLALAAFVALTTGCQDTPSAPSDEIPPDLQPGGHAVMGPESGISLGILGDSFEPGAQIFLILNNESSDDVGYNLCLHDLERRVDGEWESLQIERICTLELRILTPGGSAVTALDLPDPLPDGEYRFRVAVHLMEDGEIRDLVSDPFHVGD